MVLKRTCLFLVGLEKDRFLCWFFFFFFVLFFFMEIVSLYILCTFTAKILQAFQSTRWHQNWT